MQQRKNISIPLLFWSLCSSVLVVPVQSAGVPLDLDNHDSIKSAARRVAYDLVTFYTGNRTGDVPGNLPAPYYWWEAGAFFGALVNYWAFTGDATYNAITVQALEHQAGVKGDFMPVNQTYTEGNDDQSFWAMSAMMAAERNFPNPITSNLGWLGMVQGVFNQQAHRWDNMSCSGGLRWQIYPWNAGYGYKNTISNGGFFDIAARLARYTGNVTYAEWADKIWDWSEGVGLITPDFQIFDGTTQETNCTSYDRTRWSYTGGIWLHGAAVMYNYTSSSSTTSPSQSSAKWKPRLDGLLLAANHFYQNDSIGAQVMHEPPCEHQQRCNTDQLSFKAYLSRWLADVIQLAPHTYYDITAKVRSTAKAAARQCQGGETGTYCGHRWSSGKYDGTIGVGQQMGVLEVLHGLLATHISGPLTASTGGTSEGNTSAGTAPDETEIQEILFSHVTTGDRAGAAVLTVVFVGMLFSAVYTMIS